MTAKITSSLAKSQDGNIQITFSIPYAIVTQTKSEVLTEAGKEVEVSGFRKGMAPLDKVEARLSKETLIQKILGKILPKTFAEAITSYKIRPAIYPKFELIKADDGADWQVRAISCELPEVILGDYKSVVQGVFKAKAIWTPNKGKAESPKEPSKEGKEQEIVKALLGSVKIDVPKLLIEEEANSRLSGLLDRLEKLGLSLEGYLGSIGKTPESLRTEYEGQAKEAIILDLVLEKIAQENKISPQETEIDSVIKASSADPKLAQKLDTPEQRRVIASILRRRAALDYLASLV